MTSAEHLRKGWCPGALRPMRSGDGLLVRVRPRAGAFTISGLRAVGTAAARLGSGEIDLTNRGNLQIRGVSEQTFDAVLAELDKARLLDASPEAEAVRNVVVDPLSGLDPDHSNVRDLAEMLEDRLAREPRLWALPGKFGFNFSGCPADRVGDRSADVMISAQDDHFFIALDGAGDVRCDVPRCELVDAAHRLALAFVELRENDSSFRRMRTAVGSLGAARLFAMAGLGPPQRFRAVGQTVPVGVLTRGEGVFGVGVGLPFGRITHGEIQALCEAADVVGVERVHTSPDRILVFPVVDVDRASTLLRAAEAAGLISRPDDVRLRMDVCPGSPACKSARADTRRDAQRFASEFTGSSETCSLHISGCEKGCARRHAAGITLVGRNGCYDVIRNGTASSANVHETIKTDEIGAAVARLAMEPSL